MQRPNERTDPSTLSACLAAATRSLADGNPAAAIDALEAAIRLAPGNAPIHHDFGFLCLQAGRRQEAIVALQTALLLDPSFAQASLCLGIALQDQGDMAAAESAYRRAITLQPTLSVAHVCLGALLESRGDLTLAIGAFNAGREFGGTGLWGRLAAARALVAADHDLEAEPALREMVASHPANAMAHEMLATVLANTGRFDEARDSYERAIAAAPSLAGSYYDVVRCRRITPEDGPLVNRMRAALDSPTSSTEARIKIHLALGKALDDLGDPTAAMRHFDAACSLRETLQHFDVPAFERRVDRLIARFDRDTIARAVDSNPAHGADGDVSICIVGLPRSGTTLVEQILASHPQVFGAGELPFWTEHGAAWEAACMDSASTTETPDLGDHAALAEVSAMPTYFGAEYVKLVQGLAPDAARVTDKMPLNILWAGLIHCALPNARLISCRRSPIDVALSIHRTYFNPQVALPTGGAALVSVIRAIERLSAHWLEVLPADRFTEVAYEELVRHPVPAVRRLVGFCALPWDAACLHPERNARVIKTPSKWQARQPINSETLDSWRRFTSCLGPLERLVP